MNTPVSRGIVLLTHAGTDLTALQRVRAELPDGFVPVSGVNLQTIVCPDGMAAVLAGPVATARVVIVRVLGRTSAMPGFDTLWKDARAHGRALIVVSGTGKVTRGEETILLAENQSTYIPLGVRHRLENPGRVPLELIEVQSGSYLGEDEIVRFEDVYGRG